MDLIVNQMVQFQVVHVSDGNRAVKELAGTSVAQAHFSVPADRNTFPQFPVLKVRTQIFHYRRLDKVFIFNFELFPGQVNIVVGQLQGIHDVILVCAVKDRGGYIKAQGLGCKA